MITGRRHAFRMIAICALSMSIGWGIRGNFGHEYGAMIAGALVGLAAAILSGREDWWRRGAYFGMFGAIGWSFGGSMSYMQVIAYTHSGHLQSQIYGFACLFVLGFAWAALGGAGVALPACLERRRLTDLFPPILTVFAFWIAKDFALPYVARMEAPARRHESILYWYDSNWMAPIAAVAAVISLALVQRLVRLRVSEEGIALVLHLALGWWIGFALVVVLNRLGIEFRMTPPRGDNWAGILGMVAGLLIFCVRHKLMPVVYAALVAGFWGGFAFAAAALLKLVEVKYVPLALSQLFGDSAWQTNWHSILEQTYGLINGIGIGVAMLGLSRRLPDVADEPRSTRCTEVVATAFVLLAITYLNLVKNVPNWVQLKAIPARLYDLPARTWFDAAYVVLALAVTILLMRHLRRRIELVPRSALGKTQLLYVVFLWWIAVGNLLRAIPPLAEQRLITEGVIHVNAVLCTLFVLLWPQSMATTTQPREWSLRRITIIGLASFLLTVAMASALTRLIHGDTFVGHAGYHVRFGPDRVAPEPEKGKDHP